jgi:transposase InsO family protein
MDAQGGGRGRQHQPALRVGRYRMEGEGGLFDRSSAPKRVANRTPRDRVEAIVALRSLRMTAAEIAETLEMALSTVSGILRRGRIQGGAGKRVRGGLHKHYNYARIDAEGRRRLTVGWEFVHIAIDDHSRLAYAEVLADEKAQTAIGFLRRARAHYARYRITIERLMSDNGSAYVSAIYVLACRALGIRHLRTRPYRPQTNGKAERFIRTLLAGWAYGAVYGSSEERTSTLDGWLWHYNHRRRHSALGRQPPVTRTNLLGSYT